MWPDWASWQLEISPVTQISVKLRKKRSRILAVSSATVKARRSGIRLKVSWLMGSGTGGKMAVGGQQGHPPGNSDQYQNKGVARKAIRNMMKTRRFHFAALRDRV